MKYIKKYRMFESKRSKAEQKIEDFCDENDIDKYSVRYDYKSEFTDKPVITGCYVLDINQDVNISYQNLKSSPVKFGNINGYFSINDNEITSFKNFPSHITDGIDFSTNNIRHLGDEFPSVEGEIIGYNNPWTTMSVSDLNKLKIIDDGDIHNLLEDSPIYNFINLLSHFGLPISLYGILDKFEEFEVILDTNKIDLISLRSLFEFYKKEFQEKEFIKEFKDFYTQQNGSTYKLTKYYKLI